MPSVPIETPSETAIVLNSIGVPPPARMPSFTNSASRRWLKLQGIVSIQVVATPTSGRARSSSVKPTALSMARAGGAIRPVRQGMRVALGAVRRSAVGQWTMAVAAVLAHAAECMATLSRRRQVGLGVGTAAAPRLRFEAAICSLIAVEAGPETAQANVAAPTS